MPYFCKLCCSSIILVVMNYYDDVTLHQQENAPSKEAYAFQTTNCKIIYYARRMKIKMVDDYSIYS